LKAEIASSQVGSKWTLRADTACVSPQKRAAEFDADAPPRQAPGGAPGKPSPDQPAAEPQQQPSRPISAPPRSRDPNAPGMRPPKTGVGQRDKMRELLKDALALALDDVPDGQPGARTLAAASSENLALPQEIDVRLRSANTARELTAIERTLA